MKASREKQAIIDDYLAAWRRAYPRRPLPSLHYENAGEWSGFRLDGCLESTRYVLAETARLRKLTLPQRRPITPRRRPVTAS